MIDMVLIYYFYGGELDMDSCPIYLENKRLNCGFLCADVHCKECNIKIGELTVELPIVNIDQVNFSTLSTCPNCGKKLKRKALG